MLKKAAGFSHQLMDTLYHGLDAVVVYVDDILVASHKEASHKLHLRKLFECLRDHGLIIRDHGPVINMAKCQSGW